MKIVHSLLLIVSFFKLSASNNNWTSIYSKEDLRPFANYVSGNAFRSISNFTFVELYTEFWIDSTPESFFRDQADNIIQGVSLGDIVFVQSHLLDRFFEKVHPKISSPYILITHNGDMTVGEKYQPFFEDAKIIKWFAQNVSVENEKLVPIPIGVENRYWYVKRTLDEKLFFNVSKMEHQRNKLAYLNIALHTFEEERKFVRNFFRKKSFVVYGGKKSFSNYLKDLKRHRFCISPSGNGVDCHRTWESLLMGSIPVVRPIVKSTGKRAYGNEFLYKNLPVIIVNDWEEVTEDFLEKKFEEISNMKVDLSRLYFPYWRDLILKEASLARSEL